MTPQSFALAQQAADTAYDMTLAATGDKAQAADAYKSVMTAYYEATNQPAYDADFYRSILSDRTADAASDAPKYASLPDMMLATGRIDHMQWMAEVWPTLPEVAY